MATLDQADLDSITEIVKGPQGGFDPSDTPIVSPSPDTVDQVGTRTSTRLDGTVRVDHIIVPAEEWQRPGLPPPWPSRRRTAQGIPPPWAAPSLVSLHPTKDVPASRQVAPSSQHLQSRDGGTMIEERLALKLAMDHILGVSERTENRVIQDLLQEAVRLLETADALIVKGTTSDS